MKQTDQTGVTFAVDEVTPATQPLSECRAYEAAKDMLRSEIESCSDYHSTVVKDILYQPLLAAVYTAFSEHRPLVLTPDAVWITIVQGIAHHMAINNERLRPRFIRYQGKQPLSVPTHDWAHGSPVRSRFAGYHGTLDLVFKNYDWVEGSPENPWPEAFASWTEQIRQYVGTPVHDTLICDFSTTGPAEQAVSRIVMMDVFQRYFSYCAMSICGIPTVTLEGTSADWQHLADKAAELRLFDIECWLKHLLPICHQFVRASRGDVDKAHWQNICKLKGDYGGDVINGWVAYLFPYIRSFVDGPCDYPNPIFVTGRGFQTLYAPPGLSQVPFTWLNTITGRRREMEAVGGLVGVTQDPQTLALRPKVRPVWLGNIVINKDLKKSKS